MKKGLMVALAAIAETVSVAGCGGDGKLSNDYVTVNQYKGLEIAKWRRKKSVMMMWNRRSRAVFFLQEKRMV